MKVILNFLFASVFVLIISLASFLPLPLMKLSPSPASDLVLGQSTSSEQIQVSRVSMVENSVVAVSALAYPDQKTYYHKIFKVKNSFSKIQKYKLEVISSIPDDPNLSAQVYFEAADQVNILSLNPNEEKEVSLILALGPSFDGAITPRSYTLKILVLPLD